MNFQFQDSLAEMDSRPRLREDMLSRESIA